jgi:hypothetical protein
MYKSLIILLTLVSLNIQSQELKCAVSINSDRVVAANKEIIKTLERSLNDFVNKTKWTNTEVLPHERIDCSMFINISNMDNNQFSASIQVQSSRPVFGSTYNSPILNINDNDFTFQYIEFENMFFDPNGSNSNLTAVIAFYVHMILGMDADTYAIEGGTKYFQIAQNIVDLSQQNGNKGWKQSDGQQSRYFMVNDMMMNINAPFRTTIYQYHRLGLDNMSEQTQSGKEAIIKAVSNLETIYKVRPNSYLLRIFFDAKSEEIYQVLKDGPKVNITPLKELLFKLYPINIAKWDKLN